VRVEGPVTPSDGRGSQSERNGKKHAEARVAAVGASRSRPDRLARRAAGEVTRAQEKRRSTRSRGHTRWGRGYRVWVRGQRCGSGQAGHACTNAPAARAHVSRTGGRQRAHSEPVARSPRAVCNDDDAAIQEVVDDRARLTPRSASAVTARCDSCPAPDEARSRKKSPWAARAPGPSFVCLGGGSNRVVADEGMDSLVCRSACAASAPSRSTAGRLTAAAGEPWDGVRAR